VTEGLTGPLAGLRVLEAGGIGPGPFAAMVLSDMGADVLRIEPPRLVTEPDMTRPPRDLLFRGRRSVALDIKDPNGLATLLQMVDRADVLIEGFRPGVAERLGFGPDVCLGRVPKLVYGRVTGYGREGPLAADAGHDINYVGLSGILAHIGRPGNRPVPPLNLVGDFGGGGMLLAFGIVCALFESHRSGQGQVVDAAMVDGAALLSTMMFGMLANGSWSDELGSNTVDGGAPYYGVFETADGRFVTVGAAEPRFFAELARRLNLDERWIIDRLDPANWPALQEVMAQSFRTRTRDEWCQEFAGTDACVAPVLTLAEAPQHPHNRARGTFVEIDGVVQPAPAPRFSRTPGMISGAPPHPGQDTKDALVDWGFGNEAIDALELQGVLACWEPESSSEA
jgi:alpha-methylacyl-CoA racemase